MLACDTDAPRGERMAKRDVEEIIGYLSRLREAPVTEATRATLRKGLSDRVNLVAARAAQVAGELRLRELIPDLLAAFDRLFGNACEHDPQCWGKNAIAKALTDLDYDEAAPFLRGYRYVQMESVWGGKEDTAVTLRSLCTLALVQCAGLPRAVKLRALVDAMNDAAETVRVNALRALEQMDGEEAALLLRQKAASGDRRATVVGQAIESLLRVEGRAAIAFARDFLTEKGWGDEYVEEAALALGASRLPEAVDALEEAWAREPRVVFLQAISASRQDSGFQFLLKLIRGGRERDAMAAIEVLALHRESAEMKSAVEKSVEARGTGDVAVRFREKFAGH